ncbi:MAG: hypothetical protein JWR83_693 [Aeromicrobium sp.]|nr:hypothetical protein [Aeromicrobium sp.]
MIERIAAEAGAPASCGYAAASSMIGVDGRIQPEPGRSLRQQRLAWGALALFVGPAVVVWMLLSLVLAVFTCDEN